MMGIPAFFRVTRIDETASTNTDLKALAAQGEPEGAVLIARAQSAGRGRMGRGFHSPAGSGLYLSVLLRPRLEIADTPLLTTAAAVAACRAIELETGRSPAVKWVNDLMLHDKKIAGILVEGVPGAYAVLGLGLNLSEPAGGFPPELAGIAGALLGPEGCTEQQKNGLIARFLNEFYALYTRLPDRAYMSEYRARCTTLGRRVLVPGEPPYEASAEDIDERGALIVRLDSGEVRRVLSVKKHLI